MRTAAPSSTRSPTSGCSRSTTGASRSCTKRSSVPGRGCAPGSTTTVTTCECANVSRKPPRNGPVRSVILICCIAEPLSRRPSSGATAPMSDLRSSRPLFLDASREARDVEERAAADAERRRRRVRRFAFTVLSLLAATAAAASIVAFAALQQSKDKEAEAEERFVRSLATQAESLAPTRPKLALLLAAESAARLEPITPEAQNAIANRARNDGRVGHHSRPRTDSRR